jgi:hypothetical protein
MKKFFRRLMGDKAWYSLFEYESLPTFQALCSESKKLLDVQDRLISKLTDSNLDGFEDPNDQQLYYSVQNRIDEEINYKRCRVEGKIVANKFVRCGPPINDDICIVIMEISSKSLGVPATLEFSIKYGEHGSSQLNYASNLKKGQSIKLHGAFYCDALRSEYGIDDHQIIISNT